MPYPDMHPLGCFRFFFHGGYPEEACSWTFQRSSLLGLLYCAMFCLGGLFPRTQERNDAGKVCRQTDTLFFETFPAKITRPLHFAVPLPFGERPENVGA